MNARILSLCSLLVASLLLTAPASLGAKSQAAWTDTGAAFSAGTLGDSGQNLYINRHGALETIRRYDPDGNGHLDLLFNNTHDLFNAIPATLASINGTAAITKQLGVDGSSRVLVQDLNRDGFAELVFMPNQQNVQQQRSSIIIAWGGSDGWTTNRLTRQLPVNGIASLAAGDLNNDGWPDLLALNSDGWLFGQPAGRIVRVYWGSADGYFLSRYQDLGIPGAVELVTGRFGPQAQFPAAVLTEEGALVFLTTEAKTGLLAPALTVKLPLESTQAGSTKAQSIVAQAGSNGSGAVIWVGTNGPTLFQVATNTTQPTVTSLAVGPATHLSLGRLDDDQWDDLVLTNLKLIYPAQKRAAKAEDSVTILWGAVDGFSRMRQTAKDIPNAYATAIGDLSGDGHADLVVAVFQGDQSLKASSFIYPGDGAQRLPAERLEVATEGARGVAVARVAPGSKPVAVFANSQHRTLDDSVPLRLYWGVPGGFSTDSVVDIPNLSGYKSSASDLNGDGYVDLIVINGGDISEEAAARAPDTGINIYWGGPKGNMKSPGPTKFDFSRRQILAEKHLGSINVADLNRDGFLDLVLGAFESASNPGTDLIIYYGSAEGFSAAHRQAIAVSGRSIGCLIIDANRDGDLDIIIGAYTKNEVVTYLGHKGRFSAADKIVLPYPGPIDLEAADLNGDGWLELIVASYEDAVAHHHDTGSSIFWGGPAGWHQSRSQSLPGMTPLGLAVADLDGDGHLDLVSPHYHGELSREQLPSYIFWGSSTGFTARNRTSLIVNSASEAVIADFNGDGKPDIAFAAHSIDPGHLLESPVFFNDGNRFVSPKVQYLPANGPHYMWVQDIGNIANRQHEEIFTSRILTWESFQHSGQIKVEATTPFESRVSIQIRSAADATSLNSAGWRNVTTGSFNLSAADRALQYRLTLKSMNGDAYPIVQKVNVSLQ